MRGAAVSSYYINCAYSLYSCILLRYYNGESFGVVLLSLPMHAACNETQIKCKNGFCKPSFWRCDGVNDCGDNTDEENCGKDETSTQNHEQ